VKSRRAGWSRGGRCCTVFRPVMRKGKLNKPISAVTLAAMKDCFENAKRRPMVIIWPPDVQERRLDNPIQVPNCEAFLTYRRWKRSSSGSTNLRCCVETQWSGHYRALYTALHVMVGLGTIFIAVRLGCVCVVAGKNSMNPMAMLWAYAIAFRCRTLRYRRRIPAELGRNPGSFTAERTAHGVSRRRGRQ